MRSAFFTILAALVFGVLGILIELNIAWRRLCGHPPRDNDSLQ